jgi:exopolyphosphatase/guanosine-5'-triphosphate,3'-diphosphate pyrophosphatase
VDIAQANRVARVADHLFQSVAVANHKDERFSRKLHWSAMVHEIGAVVNHTNAARHGAYILENIEAPGFAIEELQRLSDLVRAQKGRLRKFAELLADELFAKQLFSLRLATLVCNARVDPNWSDLSATYQSGVFHLHVPSMWAAAHPNTMYLINDECANWDKSGYQFKILFC